MRSVRNILRTNHNDFGRDGGLMHEVIVNGRKLGVGRDFWSVLAHDTNKLWQIAEQIDPLSIIPIDRIYSDSDCYKTTRREVLDSLGVTYPEEYVLKLMLDYEVGCGSPGSIEFLDPAQQEKIHGQRQILDWLNGIHYRPATIDELVLAIYTRSELLYRYTTIALVGTLTGRYTVMIEAVTTTPKSPNLRVISNPKFYPAEWIVRGVDTHNRIAAVRMR